MRRALIVAFLAGLSVTAQEEYRLRVTVNLVQVDATVTDVHGKPVPGLEASDFRVLLDGQPQEVKYCTYVRLAEPTAPAPAPALATPPTAAHPAMPAEAVKREDVRRTIVLFVGDFLTSSESIPAIRSGLTKFVEQQMHSGDLVAIVRASAGLGALQDFTPDRNALLAAIDQVRWSSHALGTGGASAYEQIGQPALGGVAALNLAQDEKIDSVERATLATTASLLKVVRGMAGLPGRKSLIFLSDGLRLSSPDEMDPTGAPATGSGAFLSPIYASMRRVVDESVRAGVVLYAVDTRGQSSLLATAADRLKPAGADGGGRGSAPVPPAQGDWVHSALGERREAYRDNQWGSLFLSAQTGGFMVTEANRIDAALDRIMADQRGYYLLAFQPQSDAMHPDFTGTPEYHALKIEVARRGLTVRSHAGFFGISDDVVNRSAGPELQLAPVESAIHLSVDAGYLGEKNDSFLRTAVFLNAGDISFTGPANHRTAVLHLVVRAFDAKGIALPGGIDQIRRVDLNDDGYQRAMRWGLVYTTRLPAPKPGPYQVRVACRDEASGKTGSGGDLVTIPEPKRSLHLSGVVFQHDLGTDDHVLPAPGPNTYTAGQTVPFVFQIGGAAKPGGWQMRTRLFREGVQLWQSAASAVEGPTVKGALEVPKGLAPGTYLLRVDLASQTDPEHPAAWQWARLTLR